MDGAARSLSSTASPAEAPLVRLLLVMLLPVNARCRDPVVLVSWLELLPKGMKPIPTRLLPAGLVTVLLLIVHDTSRLLIVASGNCPKMAKIPATLCPLTWLPDTIAVDFRLFT